MHFVNYNDYPDIVPWTELTIQHQSLIQNSSEITIHHFQCNIINQASISFIHWQQWRPAGCSFIADIERTIGDKENNNNNLSCKSVDIINSPSCYRSRSSVSSARFSSIICISIHTVAQIWLEFTVTVTAAGSHGHGAENLTDRDVTDAGARAFTQAMRFTLETAGQWCWERCFIYFNYVVFLAYTLF